MQGCRSRGSTVLGMFYGRCNLQLGKLTLVSKSESCSHNTQLKVFHCGAGGESIDGKQGIWLSNFPDRENVGNLRN